MPRLFHGILLAIIEEKNVRKEDIIKCHYHRRLNNFLTKGYVAFAEPTDVFSNQLAVDVDLHKHRENMVVYLSPCQFKVILRILKLM